jgi:predicted nucleotidyltransferase
LLNLADLQLLLDKLKLIAREVILFGSRAEGTDTTESDIDLFVIAADKTAIYETVQQSTLAEKTRPVVITPIESVELKQQDPLFYEQVMRGILLWKGLSQDES